MLRLAKILTFSALTLAGAASTASANTICDLTTTGTAGPCAIGTGVFYRDDQQPTGTGYIDSFLRVQQNGWEQGYNTSYRPLQPIIQDKTDPNFTRDLPFANVGTETINGVKYATFFLDVNEQATNNGNKNLITLDQLEIFTSNVALTSPVYSQSPNGPNSNSGSLSGSNGTATKIYDMDSGADNWVQIDYNISGGGSGKSDMVFYLPYSQFSGAKYVYLYSEFGDLTGNVNNKYESGAGFEEWWTVSPTYVQPLNAVPEPSSIALLGIGLIALGRKWQKRRPQNKTAI